MQVIRMGVLCCLSGWSTSSDSYCTAYLLMTDGPGRRSHCRINYLPVARMRGNRPRAAFAPNLYGLSAFAAHEASAMWSHGQAFAEHAARGFRLAKRPPKLTKGGDDE